MVDVAGGREVESFETRISLPLSHQQSLSLLSLVPLDYKNESSTHLRFHRLSRDEPNDRKKAIRRKKDHTDAFP